MIKRCENSFRRRDKRERKRQGREGKEVCKAHKIIKIYSKLTTQATVPHESRIRQI